jgi:DNA-binding NarL/FixJ family response regulator
MEAPLIGRDATLTDLVGRGERAAAGNGGLALLAGEAGVGKTRLALAALERLRLPVLVGAGSEGGTAPYGPLLDVLRAFQRFDPGGLDDLGRNREHLALLLPELGETAADADRFAIAAAVRAGFTALGSAEPAAVLLDDLQWADEATLDLLPALAETASEAALFVVGAYRSDELPRGHALRRARTALRRARRLHELPVEPLDAGETAELAAAVLGTALSQPLAAAIWDRTQGVPFFVEEVAAALAASGRLAPADDGLRLGEQESVPLPDTVRDAVLARLDGIRPETRAGLEAAAALGTKFELDVVDALAGRVALEEAVARGVIVEQPDGRAAFRHALAREAIYAETPWSRRRQLHGELATVLEAREAPAETIAAHALAAGRPDVARPLLLEAAESYCAVHAHRDAARLVRRALELWPAGDDELRRVDALARLGHCLHLSGNAPEAVPVWREVVDLRRRTGDANGTAEAQRELANVLEVRGRTADALAAHAAAAAGFLAAGRERDAARERLAVAIDLHVLGSHADAAAEQREVQALAAACGEEELRITALALEGVEHARLGRVEQGLGLAREALALALSGGYAEAGAEAYWSNAAILVAAGDYVGARTTLQDAVDFCSRAGEDGMRRFCTSCLSYVLWRTGAWDRAVELAQAVRAEEADDPFAQAYAAITWGSVEVARGHARRARPLLAAAGAYLARIGGLPRGLTASLELALARLDVLRGDADAASGRCRRELGDAESGPPDTRDTALFRWASAHFAACGLDRETRACASVLGAVAAAYPHPEARAAAAAALGEVALRDGDGTAAASYFGHALQLLADVELPLEEAQVQVRAAAASSAAGDRDEAIKRLVAAYRIARRLGAQPLAAEAARALEALGERIDTRLGRLAAAQIRGGGLTRRELEVVRHVAVGRTNREIAEALHLSPRTVEMHVRNALSKLECRTRTEASSRAIALGLIDPISPVGV